MSPPHHNVHVYPVVLQKSAHPLYWVKVYSNEHHPASRTEFEKHSLKRYAYLRQEGYYTLLKATARHLCVEGQNAVCTELHHAHSDMVLGRVLCVVRTQL